MATGGGGAVDEPKRVIATSERVGYASEVLVRILEDHRREIAAAWLASVPAIDRRDDPDLEKHLQALIAALVCAFRDNDWADVQTVIDGLVLRRAKSGSHLERNLQRALLAGRHAVRPFLGEDRHEVEEALLDALHECMFRFSESHQGLRLASEGDRMHSRIINSLVMTLEARDPYVKGHSISVGLLAQKLASVMGYIEARGGLPRGTAARHRQGWDPRQRTY